MRNSGTDKTNEVDNMTKNEQIRRLDDFIFRALEIKFMTAEQAIQHRAATVIEIEKGTNR